MKKKTASGEAVILWDNPIFHNFQENRTKAQKTTSTKAFNSSVLPAYNLNKSVSGETKEKEKLPVVPNSLCSRGCWKKKTHNKTYLLLRWAVGRGAGKAYPQKHLRPEQSGLSFILCESEWAVLCQPGSKAWRCCRCLLRTGFHRNERRQKAPCITAQATIPAHFETLLNLNASNWYPLGYSSC